MAQEVEQLPGSQRVAGSHPGRVEVSLSKTPNPKMLLTGWLVPCMVANRRWLVCVWMGEWEASIVQRFGIINASHPFDHLNEEYSNVYQKYNKKDGWRKSRREKRIHIKLMHTTQDGEWIWCRIILTHRNDHHFSPPLPSAVAFQPHHFHCSLAEGTCADGCCVSLSFLSTLHHLHTDSTQYLTQSVTYSCVKINSSALKKSEWSANIFFIAFTTIFQIWWKHYTFNSKSKH